MRIPTRRKRRAILSAIRGVRSPTDPAEDTIMKTRALLAALAVALLAACAESPTGPSAQPSTTANYGSITQGSGL